MKVVLHLFQRYISMVVVDEMRRHLAPCRGRCLMHLEPSGCMRQRQLHSPFHYVEAKCLWGRQAPRRWPASHWSLLLGARCSESCTPGARARGAGNT